MSSPYREETRKESEWIQDGYCLTLAALVLERCAVRAENAGICRTNAEKHTGFIDGPEKRAFPVSS